MENNNGNKSSNCCHIRRCRTIHKYDIEKNYPDIIVPMYNWFHLNKVHNREVITGKDVREQRVTRGWKDLWGASDASFIDWQMSPWVYSVYTPSCVAMACILLWWHISIKSHLKNWMREGLRNLQSFGNWHTPIFTWLADLDRKVAKDIWKDKFKLHCEILSVQCQGLKIYSSMDWME